MKTKLTGLYIIGMLVMASAVAQAVPVLYTGTLEAPVLAGSPGIEGTGAWVPASPGTPVTSLTYTVSRDTPADPWLYEYVFTTTAQGGLSHLVIEVSAPSDDGPGFTEDDVVPDSASVSYELGTATSANGNPNIPGSIYSLKFDGNGQTTDTISFKSFKAPVWGDFYAKDGKAGGLGVNTAWNAGFLAADPLLPPDTDPGLTDFHILRPDTEDDPGGGTTPTGDPPLIPEPHVLGLAGIAALAARRRRR